MQSKLKNALKLLVVAPLLVVATQAKALTVWVGEFSSAGAEVPAPWRVVQIDKRVRPTVYRVRQWDGVNAIEAQAVASMALLARPLEIDLNSTPILCWRWRIDAALQTADLNQKSGDDYAARVYLALRLPPERMGFAARARLRLARALYGEEVPDGAINFVWDNRHPVGTRRPNAYTALTKMVVQQSGAEKAGEWVSERVNVKDEIRQAFDTEGASLASVALASDTDNTGETARAGFADLHFVGAGATCDFPKMPRP
jgi:hypothetical protein